MVEDFSARSTLAVALIGADAFLAARPSTPVQVLHGCLDAGFAAAYPVTWGDELVARACLASLAQESAPRVALCSCPFASRRVDETQLPAARLAIAAPPVAAARLVRAAYGEHPVRITFIGGCPSAIDASIDAHVTPAAFLDTLRDRGIELSTLPEVFESVLPPDRRRFLSVPGGAPTAELLADEGWRRVFCPQEVESGEALLIDLAPATGCLCAGGAFGRASVEELEPPRAQSPVVDPLIAVDMRPTPAFAPTPWQAPEPPAIEPAPIAASGDILPDPNEQSEHGPKEDVVVAGDGAGAGPASERPGVEEPLVGEVNDVPRGSFEPRARRWAPTPTVVLPDALPAPRRRFSGLAIGLAIALGVTLPLAAIGAWALWRNGAGALRRGSAPAAPIAVNALSTDSSVHQVIDSATQTRLDSASTAVAVTPDSALFERRVDSAAGQTAPSHGSSAQPAGAQHALREGTSTRSVAREPARPRVQLESSRRTTAESRPGPPRQTAPVDSAHTGDGTISIVAPIGDSAVTEREAIMRDIAIRRAGADSLARVVDSLNKLRERPPKKP